MKTRRILCGSLAAFQLTTILLLSGCASPEKEPVVIATPEDPPKTATSASFDTVRPRKLAVVSVRPEQGNLFRSGLYLEREAPLYEMLEDYFTDSMLSKGYTVASRADVGRLLKEIGHQNSGVTEAGAAKLGKMLNVSSVLILRAVNPNQVIATWGPQREEFSVTVGARLVSVETAEILWIGNYTHRKVVTRPALSDTVHTYGAIVETLFVEAGKKLASTFPDLK